MSIHSAKMQCAAGHGGITKKELTRNTGILTFNLKEAAKLLRRKKTANRILCTTGVCYTGRQSRQK